MLVAGNAMLNGLSTAQTQLRHHQIEVDKSLDDLSNRLKSEYSQVFHILSSLQEYSMVLVSVQARLQADWQHLLSIGYYALCIAVIIATTTHTRTRAARPWLIICTSPIDLCVCICVSGCSAARA